MIEESQHIELQEAATKAKGAGAVLLVTAERLNFIFPETIKDRFITALDEWSAALTEPAATANVQEIVSRTQSLARATQDLYAVSTTAAKQALTKEENASTNDHSRHTLVGQFTDILLQINKAKKLFPFEFRQAQQQR